MSILSIIVFGGFYMLSIVVILQKREAKVYFNTHNIIALTFVAVYYFLFFLCYILTLYGYNSEKFTKFMQQYESFEIMLYFGAVFLVTHVFLFILRKKRRIVASDYELGRQIRNYSDDKIVYIGICLFFVGLVSDFLYLRAYGGYANYLRYSSALRAGVSIVSNKFSFLIVFRECVNFSSYIFFSKIKENNKINIYTLFLFIISAFFSMRILFSNGGRLSFLLYFLVMIAYFLCGKKNIKFINLKTIFKGAIGSIVALFALMQIGNLLSRNISNNIVVQMTKELSFIFVNFISLLKNLTIENWRWFIDAVIFPIYLLPSSIWSSKWGIKTASTINTILISGAAKGTGQIYGEMPVDFISLSYMQLGFIGLIVFPIAFAFLFCKVLKYSQKIVDTNVRKIVKYYIVIIMGIETIFYADPQHIVNSIFALIVFFIMYSVLSHVRIGRKNGY